MASKDTPVDQLFKELDENITNAQYKKAIRVCNKILTVNSGDVEAYHCKIICLMQLGNFQEAYDLIKSPQQIETYSFEKMYCLYALNKYEDAIKNLNSLNQKSNKLLELEAQIHYKLENYQKTISIYESLLKESGYSDSPEFVTNLCAVYIDAGKKKECQELLNKNKSNMNKVYELAFNSACLMLSKADYKSAESQLKLARKVCIDSLKKDDFTDEEIEDELVSVDVQLAFTQQKLLGATAVSETYEKIIAKKLEDSASLIAINNFVTLKADHLSNDNPNEHKELVAFLDQLKSVVELESKLNSSQKRSVHLNVCYLLLQLKRVQQCEEQMKLLRASPLGKDITEELDLLEAQLLLKEKKFRESEAILKKYSSLKAKILLSQMYLFENDVKKSVAVLESLESAVKAKPAIIATMVALYEKSGDVEKSIASIDEMIKSLESKKNRSEQEEESYVSLLKASGNAKLKHHKYKEAAEIFDRILKSNPNDLIALPNYIIATSHFDPTLAQKYESKLPTIKVDSKVDIDAIEKSGLIAIKDKKNSTTPAKQLKKKSTPVITASGKELDPERWLPKYQRAAARSQRNRKQKDAIFRGPQGVSSDTQASQLFTTGANPSTANSNVTPQKTEKALNAHKKKGGSKKK